MSSAAPGYAPYDWADPFRLEEALTDEEKMVRDTARAYCQESLLPRVVEANRKEIFHKEIMTEFGELGLLGATVSPEYGGAGM